MSPPLNPDNPSLLASDSAAITPVLPAPTTTPTLAEVAASERNARVAVRRLLILDFAEGRAPDGAWKAVLRAIAAELVDHG